MALADIRKAFVAWTRSATSYDASHVLWADQNFPRVTKPYITLKLTAFNSLNHDYNHPPDPATGYSLVTGDREFTLEVQCYGNAENDPLEVLLDLHMSLGILEHLRLLQNAGVAYVNDLLGPTDISMVLGKTYERRASLDLLMRVPWSATDESTGIIGSVDVESVYKNPDGSIVSNVNEIIS